MPLVGGGAAPDVVRFLEPAFFIAADVALVGTRIDQFAWHKNLLRSQESMAAEGVPKLDSVRLTPARAIAAFGTGKAGIDHHLGDITSIDFDLARFVPFRVAGSIGQCHRPPVKQIRHPYRGIDSSVTLGRTARILYGRRREARHADLSSAYVDGVGIDYAIGAVRIVALAEPLA